MTCKKVSTGDPNCPPHISSSQNIFRQINQATDGSVGELDLNFQGFNAGDNDEQEEEEEDDKDEEQVEFDGEALDDDSPGGFGVSLAEDEVVTVTDSAQLGADSTVAVAELRVVMGGSGLDAV